MKISLIGYGKMGRDIEALALAEGHEIVRVFDKSRPLTPSDLSGSDVAIEFTEPASAVNNLFMAFEAGVPIVTGTTGWYNRLPEVRNRCTELEQTLFYASNFSLGVYLFNRLNAVLATWMNGMESYRPKISETHHLHKKDAPSGTAITLGENLLDHYDRLSDWTDDSNDVDKLWIEAFREEGVPGTHEISYSSEVDSISIKHEAHSRQGFVGGALKAAEWVHNKKGIYTVSDLMKETLGPLA